MAQLLHYVQHTVNLHVAQRGIYKSAKLLHTVHMRLKQLRQAQGMSQEELAERIGATKSTVSRAENMHHSAKLETYQLCAEVLGVTLEDIFSGARDPIEERLVRAFRHIPADRHADLVRLLEVTAGVRSEEEGDSTSPAGEH